MATKRYEVVEITAVYDRGTDGNSRNVIGYYKSELVAQRFIEAKGPYSAMFGMNSRKALRVGSKYFLLKQEEPIEFEDERDLIAKKRAEALAKLSPMERKLLGLT